MKRREFEPRPPTASHLRSNGNMVQLVEQWIGQFESQIDDEPFDAPSPEPRPIVKRGRANPHYQSSLENLKSEWNRLAESDRRKATGVETPPTTKRIAFDALPLKCTGLVTTFSDRIGGSISLSPGEGHLQHRGTVAIRRRGSSVEAVCGEIGLPDQVTRAFEFVAAWFGFPFDSANLRIPDGRVLSWGFWDFAGNDLARCLQEWKRRAPETFAEHLSAFGVDVLTSASESGAQGPTAAARAILSVQVDQRSIHGRAAEWTIAGEPRLLAVLARAGRDVDAQRVQIEVALARWVTPVLFHPWVAEGSGERLIVDVLKAPTHLAALIYLVRRLGPRAATRLITFVHERWRPQENEDAWLAGLIRSLRNLNRENDACEVLRISSSPELTIG